MIFRILVSSAFIFLLNINSIFCQENTIGVTHITDDAFEGYTFFSSGKNTQIIDNCGRLIKQWQSEYFVSNSAYLLNNGNVLRTGRDPESFFYTEGGILELFNWEGELLWNFKIDDADFIQHHDIEPLPNGNILVLAYNFKNPEEAWNAGALDSIEYWSTSILELEPIEPNSANIVWEWHLWDHLVQEIDSTRTNFGTVNSHPELFNINNMHFPNDTIFKWEYARTGPELMHMNSIDYNETRDEILLSSRDHNEIYIIDHSTTTLEAASHEGGNSNEGGDFLYRFGANKFYGQHDAHWINKMGYDENSILVFNNGFRYDDQSRFYSSADLLIPKFDEFDSYQYNQVDTFKVVLNLDGLDNDYSPIMGSAQLLDNGNVLICNSQRGRFFEYDKSRNLNWQYVNPYTFSGINSQGNQYSSLPLIFRAKKILPDHPALNREWEVGLPIELNHDIEFCELFDSPVEEPEVIPSELRIFPNPCSNFVTIRSPDEISNVDIYNSQGIKKTLPLIGENTYLTQDLPNGLYFLSIVCEEEELEIVKLVISN